MLTTCSRQGDRTGNCESGLVVDQQITDGTSSYAHFYLQSQGGLKGSTFPYLPYISHVIHIFHLTASRPSHYAVVYNEDKSLTADNIQGLSYALCHTHARATRSIGIPAPVYCKCIQCYQCGAMLI